MTSRISIVFLSSVLFCVAGGCSQRLAPQPGADFVTENLPIRLQFGPPVALIAPSNAEETERAKEVLEGALREATIDAVVESKVGSAFQDVGERLWVQRGTRGSVNRFHERAFSMDPLRKAQIAQDVRALLGKPDPSLRQDGCGYWLLCNGKKGSDFRAYQIIVGFIDYGLISFIYVNTGKPVR